MRAVPALLLMAAVLAACLAPAPSPSPTVGTAPTITARASPDVTIEPEATSSAVPTASPLPPVAADPPPLALEPVADGLAEPIGISAAPGGWLLVNEQAGRVVAIHPERGERATVLDIRGMVSGGGERGLLGLALHPRWPDVDRAFVHYSDRNGDTVLVEFAGSQAGDAAPALDAGSERLLLGVLQPYANHNGGQLAFGHDGYLYVGLGDGGSGGDPHGNGQNAATLLGGILRLDIDTIPDDGNDAIGYGIPDDNPFAGDDARRPELFLYGLRNPWRFSFDSASGQLWIADVGQRGFEEVNRVDPATDAGANLGWNVMEASHCFAVAGCSTEGLTLPLVEYGRDGGCSVTGGYVYRGQAIADLAGWYLFGDYCSGRLWGVASDAEPPAAGETVEPRLLAETSLRITAFGQGDDGEVYLADRAGGRVYRIVARD